MKYCRVCEKPLINSRRRKTCSTECSKIYHADCCKEYSKEIRQIRKELGRCIVCDREKVDVNKVMCLDCRTKHNKYYIEWRRKKNGN